MLEIFASHCSRNVLLLSKHCTMTMRKKDAELFEDALIAFWRRKADVMRMQTYHVLWWRMVNKMARERSNDGRSVGRIGRRDSACDGARDVDGSVHGCARSG